MTGPCCVGIDLSSKCVDLVRLNENTDQATWLTIPLAGDTAWARTRQIPQLMPKASFWDDVYLCAIEQPYGPSRRAQSVLMRAQGAILATVPGRVEVWEVTPDQWRGHLGVPRTVKPSWSHFASGFFDEFWPQDARDALAVALYARDVNARGVADALAGAA